MSPQSASVTTVRAPLTFLARDGERPDGATERDDGRFQFRRDVAFLDGRDPAEPFELERHGFCFTRHHSAVTDFADEDHVKAVYYPEMERLVQEISGADRVHMFDHTLRAGDADSPANDWWQESVNRTVNNPHNDYTDWSATKRLGEILPHEAEALSQGRFAIIQVWRPIRSPIERQPLAMCDASSLTPDDFAVIARERPERTGEIQMLHHNPDHRWYHFPRMTKDEVLIFKTYDSDHGNPARFTAHASFDDPAVPEDAPGRISTDVRLFAFFGD
jgi:hypothetical protein